MSNPTPRHYPFHTKLTPISNPAHAIDSFADRLARLIDSEIPLGMVEYVPVIKSEYIKCEVVK